MLFSRLAFENLKNGKEIIKTQNGMSLKIGPDGKIDFSTGGIQFPTESQLGEVLLKRDKLAGAVDDVMQILL